MLKTGFKTIKKSVFWHENSSKTDPGAARGSPRAFEWDSRRPNRRYLVWHHDLSAQWFIPHNDSSRTMIDPSQWLIRYNDTSRIMMIRHNNVPSQQLFRHDNWPVAIMSRQSAVGDWIFRVLETLIFLIFWFFWFWLESSWNCVKFGGIKWNWVELGFW